VFRNKESSSSRAHRQIGSRANHEIRAKCDLSRRWRFLRTDYRLLSDVREVVRTVTAVAPPSIVVKCGGVVFRVVVCGVVLTS